MHQDSGYQSVYAGSYLHEHTWKEWKLSSHLFHLPNITQIAALRIFYTSLRIVSIPCAFPPVNFSYTRKHLQSTDYLWREIRVYVNILESAGKHFSTPPGHSRFYTCAFPLSIYRQADSRVARQIPGENEFENVKRDADSLLCGQRC